MTTPSVFDLARTVALEAAKEGFDWDHPSLAFGKVHEEFLEVQEAFEAQPFDHSHLAEEIGDLLVAITTFARHVDVDPEEALRKGTHKFQACFEHFKEVAQERGFDIKNTTSQEKSAFWKSLKAERPL